MIILNEKKDIISNNPNQIKQFKIKSSPKGFSILIEGLYSNKVEAILRELGCNAADAHKEINNTRPFQVKIPNSLDPEFYIRDFGSGIDEESIENVYTVLFESTKEGSNDFTGCLGLGSKTPFAYTNNFFVTSFQNGTKKVYNLFTGDVGEPQFVKVHEGETDEPNGLMVKFAVKPNDFWRFQSSAEKVYQHFSQKPEILGAQINFTEIQPVFEGVNYKVFKGNNGGKKLIMGNVAYPLDNFLSHSNSSKIADLFRSYHFHLFVDIGTCNVAPSRESLSYNSITISKIEEIALKIYNDIESKVLDEIEKASKIKCYFEFCKKIQDIRSAIPYSFFDKISKNQIIHKETNFLYSNIFAMNDLFYKEQLALIESSETLNDCVYKFDWVRKSTQYVLQQKTHLDFQTIQIENVAFMTYDPNQEKYVKNRLRQYCDKTNINTIILIPNELEEIFLKHVPLTKSYIKEFDLPKYVRQTPARRSSKTTLETKVTKDSVRAKNVLECASGVPYVENIIHKDTPNVFYFEDNEGAYLSEMRKVFGDFIKNEFDASKDDYFLITLDRTSFVDKVKSWDNHWVNIEDALENILKENESEEMAEAIWLHEIIKDRHNSSSFFKILNQLNKFGIIKIPYFGVDEQFDEKRIDNCYYDLMRVTNYKHTFMTKESDYVRKKVMPDELTDYYSERFSRYIKFYYENNKDCKDEALKNLDKISKKNFVSIGKIKMNFHDFIKYSVKKYLK